MDDHGPGAGDGNPPARPTARLIEWAGCEIGVLFHLDLQVIQPGYEMIVDGVMQVPPPVELFNPVELDTDQWLAAAKSAGATYAVLTAKHGTGFILFPDPDYDYSIMNTPFRNGQADIVKDFVDSCHKHGIKPGLYYHCGANAHLGIHVSTGHFPPRPSPGWDEYTRIVTRHLTRLWTRYGDVFEIWFDGGVLEDGPDCARLLERYQPGAVTFQGPAMHPHRIRWVGNERGLAPYPCWSTIHATGSYDGTREIDDAARAGDPAGVAWVPAETDVPLRFQRWMWGPDQDAFVAPPGEIMRWYYQSVGRNSNLLVGVVIDDRGLVPGADVEALAEFGREITTRFATPVLATSGTGMNIVLECEDLVEFNHVVLMEDIASGHRIREFVIEQSLDGTSFTCLARGSAIGHKCIVQFPRTSARVVQLRVLDTIDEPRVTMMAIFDVTYLEDEIDESLPNAFT